MKIVQSRTFEKKVKQLTKVQKIRLDKEIKKIAGDPLIGEKKKGDLLGVLIHKFKIKTDLYKRNFAHRKDQKMKTFFWKKI